ncbi:MAG: hypothetical protein AB7O43_02470 [Hyphomicrobiaceae bacterium]
MAGHSRHIRNVCAGALSAVGVFALIDAAIAQRSCEIKDSPCYPWRIDPGQEETSLLEVVPNNAITGATFRICVCPPTNEISLVFDFHESRRTLGTMPDATSGPVCRDFRIQTARSSRLLVRRAEKGDTALEGCYVTY